MSIFKHSPKALPIFFSFFLLSCVGGMNGVKTLGTKANDASRTTATDTESFAVLTVFRNETVVDDTREVQLQGSITNGSANYYNICGINGANCTCTFYNNLRTVSATATAISISQENNTITCTIPSSVDPDDYKYVLVKTLDANKQSGLLEIKTTLKIEDILGSALNKNNVRKIYRYSCYRTFIEGEGVVGSTNTVNCISGQSLGFLRATYSYYLYESTSAGSNKSSEFGGDSTFGATICGYNAGLKTACTGVGTTDLRYGLYSEYAPPFVVEVALTAKPEGNIATPTKGFAALPDNAGNCPVGLIKIRPFRAQPKSFVSGDPLPAGIQSNFINSNNSLTSTLVEDATLTFSDFQVFRIPNTGNAYPNGKCTTNATTNPPFLCDEIKLSGSPTQYGFAYTAEAPVVCAIPKVLINF